MLLQIQTPEPARPAADDGPALWRLGFRPFYLLGAAFAAVGVPLWVVFYAGAARAPAGLPAHLWHSHEMVFGFAVAIIAGFLFTAVRNWTNLPTPRGARLAALAALWLAVRVAYLAGAPGLAFALELAFLALVAFALLAVLVRARNRRNYFVGVLFVVLALADGAFYAAATGAWTAFPPDAPVRFALYLVVTLTFVIGGRVIPMFTANAIRGLSQFRDARLDRAAIAAGVLAFGLELAGAPALATVPAALAAAGLHAARLWGWRPLATRARPILWILHAGYAWICVGFVMLAAAGAGLVARPLALHAFALGAVGGLVIGMITRTALGHTGRMLTAGRSETTMYVLVQLAALARVFGPLLLPQAALGWVEASAALWCAAFAVYLVAYWPKLSRPRVDGQPG
ncbi:MAG: NnrS family protein [Burkholderiaceae bacterium]